MHSEIPEVKVPVKLIAASIAFGELIVLIILIVGGEFDLAWLGILPVIWIIGLGVMSLGMWIGGSVRDRAIQSYKREMEQLKDDEE